MRTVGKDRRPACPRCGGAHVCKCGLLRGQQRFLCKSCGYQFTRRSLKGKRGSDKAIAITLYSFGLTLEAIAGLLQVSATAVFYWIKKFEEQAFSRPEPAEMVTVPLEKLLRYLPKKAGSQRSHIVIVPVDEKTGEIAGMINVPAATSPSPAMEQESAG